jgi:hypothetical protein
MTLAEIINERTEKARAMAARMFLEGAGDHQFRVEAGKRVLVSEVLINPAKVVARLAQEKDIHLGTLPAGAKDVQIQARNGHIVISYTMEG